MKDIINKPLLRWAGGKTWLTTTLFSFLPLNIKNYYEPFVGSGAIFFKLKSNSIIESAYLSDINIELINFYNVLKNKANLLIDELKKYKNTKTFYYQIRGKKNTSKIKRAAQFYYLNRTSFNGIYRVNLEGFYNVPYGSKIYNKLFDYELIKIISKFLKNTYFSHCDFENILKDIKKDDLIYIDPPYTTAHNNNGFIKYNQNLFSFDDQIRLSNFLKKINSLGAHYLLSNAHHKNIYDIFSKDSNTFEIKRYSSISGNNKGRRQVLEYIFTNYEVKK
jgi:DNA adenine methylase